tara:strand:+ start:17673 stop:18710 length:1038 start_codon:yes stop_codon:yes gene_type:complete
MDNHKIIIVASFDKYSSKFKTEEFDYHPIFLNNNSKNPLADIKLLYQYYKLYKKIKPDIICHNAIKPNIYGTIAAKLLDIPVINNISGLGTLFIKTSLSTHIAKLLYKFSQKYANTVFFQNQNDLSLFVNENLIDFEKVKLIPGSGVDTNLFKQKKNESSDIFKFIFVGRLLIDKGIIELYDAVLKLSKIRNDFKVIIIGDRYESNETCITKAQLDLFKNNSLFDFVGHTDKVYDELIKANCLILPSYREGLSKVLIEAGSSGIPCITTDVPGCKDVIIDGFNGFIVTPKNSDSILEAMMKILNCDNNKLIELSNNARKNILDKFSIDIVNKIYITEIYKSIKIK